VLVGEDIRTGQSLIEAVGRKSVPPEELATVQACTPTKRYIWVDPFNVDSLYPHIIANVLAYSRYRVFGSPGVTGRLKNALRIDRYSLTLRLANYGALEIEQLRAIEAAVKHGRLFTRVTVEPG